MMLRGGAYGLSLADLEAAPHGIDLGPLEPRLPEALRTASGKVELGAGADRRGRRAPARVAPDGAATAAWSSSAGAHLRSNNSWMNKLGRSSPPGPTAARRS